MKIGLKRVSCVICFKRVMQFRSMKLVMKTNEGMTERHFCPSCSKTFKEMRDLGKTLDTKDIF